MAATDIHTADSQKESAPVADASGAADAADTATHAANPPTKKAAAKKAPAKKAAAKKAPAKKAAKKTAAKKTAAKAGDDDFDGAAEPELEDIDVAEGELAADDTATEEDEPTEKDKASGDFVWDEEESEALRQARKDAELTASADSVRAYLKQIGKVALLNAEEEVELAKRIEPASTRRSACRNSPRRAKSSRWPSAAT